MKKILKILNIICILISLVKNPKNKLLVQILDVNVLGSVDIDLKEFDNQKKKFIKKDFLNSNKEIIGYISLTIKWIYSKKKTREEKILKVLDEIKIILEKLNILDSNIFDYYNIFTEMKQFYYKNTLNTMESIIIEEEIEAKSVYAEIFKINKIKDNYYKKFRLLLQSIYISLFISMIICTLSDKIFEITIYFIFLYFCISGYLKENLIYILIFFLSIAFIRDLVEIIFILSNDKNAFINWFLFKNIFYKLVVILNYLNIVIKLVNIFLLYNIKNLKITYDLGDI